MEIAAKQFSRASPKPVRVFCSGEAAWGLSVSFSVSVYRGALMFGEKVLNGSKTKRERDPLLKAFILTLSHTSP